MTMNKCLLLSLISFFILSTSCALAGTTSLTTNYPPPTAAYNKVKLATNATASYSANVVSVGSSCSFPNNTIFTDPTGALYECTGNVIYAYCLIPGSVGGPTYLNNGAILADTNGGLHVCMNGISASYPQECYNSFCTPSVANGSCYNYVNHTQSSLYPANCQNGFARQYLDTKNNISERIITGNGTSIYSVTCCSGMTIPQSNPGVSGGTAGTTMLGAGSSTPPPH